MKLTAQQIANVEWETGRVVRAVGQFADKPTREGLDQALYILAEVRNAASLLCDPSITGDTRQIAIDNLLELFKED